MTLSQCSSLTLCVVRSTLSPFDDDSVVCWLLSYNDIRFGQSFSCFQLILTRLLKQKSKQTEELAVRIQDAENSVQRLVSEEDDQDSSRQSAGDPEVQQRQQDVFIHDEGSDDDLDDDETEESFDALEERFHVFEEEVAILVAEVHDVVLYSKLNITGFMKILKVSSLVRII